MRTTLKKKYILTGILLIIGFLAFLFLSAAVFQNRLMDEWNNEEMESVADKILEELDKSGWDLNQTEIEVLAFENNVSVTIADEDYKVLSSSCFVS